jgi:hypothetical protein
MPKTTLRKRLALTGSGLFAASLSVIPFAGSASAAAASPMSTVGDNDAVNVQTEYNCNRHSLSVDVKNKLDKDISPTVTFDQVTPTSPGLKPIGGEHVPIKPGKTQTYLYYFSGNEQTIPVNVAVDGRDPVEVKPNLSCSEPVSFKVTEHSDKTIIGYLTNNNSLYGQDVTLTTIEGGRQDIHLAPAGQEGPKLVSVPFNGSVEQTVVSVKLTVGSGFESNYLVDLTQPSAPPMPMPEPKS